MAFDQLIERAEQERTQTKYEQSARSYAAAYHSLSTEERVGLKGEIAVENALSSYRLAYQLQPNRVFLEEPVRLLEEFAETRGQAHLMGQAKAVPVRLRAELPRLQKKLDDTRPSEEPSAAPLDEVKSEDRDQSLVDVVLLATGLASSTLGVGLLVRGTRISIRTERLANERLEGLLDLDISQSAALVYRRDLETWKRQSQRVSRNLMVAGSLITVAGGTLALVGGIRMVRKNRRRSARQVSIGLPVVLRDRIDVAVTLAF